MASFTSGQKFFLPAKHLWLRLIKQQQATATACRYPWSVEIGMSRRGLDDIGDISNMKTAQAFLSGTSSRFVRHGQDLLHIEWGAHIITTADELYHTQWETIFDTSTIKAPVSGKVEDIQLLASPEEEELDEDMVLVTLKTDAEALREGMEREGWMVEHDYDEYIQHAPPGKFQSD